MATRGSKIEEVGWGVIFAQDANPALREALAPLLELRRGQAGELFRVFGGSAGLRPRENAAGFMERHRGGLPHYLLLVGDEEAIPLGFQTQLAAKFEVGRIFFDRLEDYATYAVSAKRAERGEDYEMYPIGSSRWPHTGLLFGDPALGRAARADSSTRSPSLGSTVKGGLGLDREGGSDYDFGDELLSARTEESLDRAWRDEGRRGGTETESVAGWMDDGGALAVPAEAAVKDEVAFSAWPPKRLAPGAPRKLLVYLHLEAALRQVEDDANGRHGAAASEFRRSEAKNRARLAKDTEVLLVPQGEGLAFEPPEAYLVWSPPWQLAEFEIVADNTRAGHVANGSIGCFVGPLQIAEIPLKINVLEPGAAAPDEEPAEPVVAKLYQSIFASYSHTDTALVAAMEKAYEALGNDYLRDVMTLKPGQEWSEELLAMIDRADIFQLFWSQKASESPYVEQEWRRALKRHRRKGGAFIRPLCWEDPMPKVPRELSRIHFKAVEISPLGALIPVAAPAKPPEPAKGRNVKTFAGGELAAWTVITPEGDVENRFIDPKADAVYLDQHKASVHAAVIATD